MTDVVDGEVVEDDDVKALAHRPSSLAQADEWSVTELKAQMDKIQEAMRVAMKDGEHYGVIPGTNKPTLLKPGAEKLCVLFRLGPKYRTDKTFHENGHLTVTAICALQHIPTGNFVAEGEGLCSTMESKYRYRNDQRTCPQCGKPAIIKGKAEYGGGWVCFKKKDGCGAKFSDGDSAIEGQSVGKVENPDLADSYNTVLKMACKRALIAACLNGTAASDIFTQDLDVDVTGSAHEPPSTDSAEPQAASRDAASSSPPPAANPTAAGGAPLWQQWVNQYGAQKVKEVAGVSSIADLSSLTREQQEAVTKALADTDWEAPKQGAMA